MNKNNLPDNQSNFILYTGNDGKVSIEVFLKDETVWLTKKAIDGLFCKERNVITKHLKNIFVDRELDEKSNMQKMHFNPNPIWCNLLSDRRKPEEILR
jgi:hypothetical protein